jgi:hypothetical protein
MIAVIGYGAVLVLLIVVVFFYLPREFARLVRQLDESPETSIQRLSDEMLARMDRNVAERRALRRASALH